MLERLLIHINEGETPFDICPKAGIHEVYIRVEDNSSVTRYARDPFFMEFDGKTALSSRLFKSIYDNKFCESRVDIAPIDENKKCISCGKIRDSSPDGCWPGEHLNMAAWNAYRTDAYERTYQGFDKLGISKYQEFFK